MIHISLVSTQTHIHTYTPKTATPSCSKPFINPTYQVLPVSNTNERQPRVHAGRLPRGSINRFPAEDIMTWYLLIVPKVKQFHFWLYFIWEMTYFFNKRQSTRSAYAFRRIWDHRNRHFLRMRRTSGDMRVNVACMVWIYCCLFIASNAFNTPARLSNMGIRVRNIQFLLAPICGPP